MNGVNNMYLKSNKVITSYNAYLVNNKVITSSGKTIVAVYSNDNTDITLNIPMASLNSIGYDENNYYVAVYRALMSADNRELFDTTMPIITIPHNGDFSLLDNYHDIKMINTIVVNNLLGLIEDDFINILYYKDGIIYDALLNFRINNSLEEVMNTQLARYNRLYFAKKDISAFADKAMAICILGQLK